MATGGRVSTSTDTLPTTPRHRDIGRRRGCPDFAKNRRGPRLGPNKAYSVGEWSRLGLADAVRRVAIHLQSRALGHGGPGAPRRPTPAPAPFRAGARARLRHREPAGR